MAQRNPTDDRRGLVATMTPEADESWTVIVAGHGAPADQITSAVFREGEGLAADLADTAVGRLFASSLALHLVLAEYADEHTTLHEAGLRTQLLTHVQAALTGMDETIHDIRTTIFDPPHAAGTDRAAASDQVGQPGDKKTTPSPTATSG